MWVLFLGQEGALKEEMATHSSILAWRIPGTEKPGGLQSVELQRVRQDWAWTHTHTFLENVYQYWSQEEKTFHCIISIDTEKACDKIKHPVMIKISEQTRERRELQLDKRHVENPAGDIILSKDWRLFPCDGTKQECSRSPLLFKIVLEVLASIPKQGRERYTDCQGRNNYLPKKILRNLQTPRI